MATYEATCGHCGKTFRTTRSKNQSWARYCSRDCFDAARGAKPPVTKQCEHCGGEFTVIASIADRSRFCSRACYWATGEMAGHVPNVVAMREHGETRGRKKVYLGRDENGKPRYIQRSHHVWNQAHPDDPVLPGEEVHHIDLDKQNDDPGNLKKLPKPEHHRLHGDELRTIPVPCAVCGSPVTAPPSQKRLTCSNRCGAIMREQRRKAGLPPIEARKSRE